MLTAQLAPLYPQFEPGDLLVSLRELDLVVGARPSAGRIVWWRNGVTSARHDASFVEGHIEGSDNNAFAKEPRILRLDLEQQRAEVVFDLTKWQLLMPDRGNFEWRRDRLLTVDGDAGRVVAGRLVGSIDFIMENGFLTSDAPMVNLVLRNAADISPVAFRRFQAGFTDQGQLLRGRKVAFAQGWRRRLPTEQR